MSIDARVASVVRHDDGSGKLILTDRPALRPGDYPGVAGQSAFRFDASPAEVLGLAGMDLWGGSSFLMLGDVEIADRVGYTRIKFHSAETIARAIDVLK